MTYKNLNPNFSKSEIGQWHPIFFLSQKIIPIKTCYKIHNKGLLAIIKAFKTWRHYLEGCKYKVFIFTDYNHLY